FLFPAATYLAELERLQPDLCAAARIAFEACKIDNEIARIDAATFAQCASLSVDHGVLEKSDRVAMVPATFRWSDIGSWDALWERAERDATGNATRGDVRLIDARDSYVHAQH